MLQSKLGRAFWTYFIFVSRNQRVTGILVSRKRCGRAAGMRSMWLKHQREAAIHAYMPEVKKIARQVRHMFADHIELRDLEQAGYVGLCEAASRYQPVNGPFPQFAYFRVRGAIIDANKRRAYREAAMDSIQAIADANDGWLPPELERVCPAPLADAQAERAQMQETMQYCIRRLQPISQQILQRVLAGQSISQICRDIGRSDKWVKDRSDRAKAELREMLAVEGVTHG